MPAERAGAATVPMPGRVTILVLASAVVVGVLVPAVLGSPKVALYVDPLSRSGLYGVLLGLSLPAALVALRFPRAALYASALLLPFSASGPEWGELWLLTVTKVALKACLLAALYCALLAEPERRAWLTRTPLGVALLFWLSLVAIGIAIGFFGESRDYWVRESSWMCLYVFAIPVGILVRERAHVQRLVGALLAGAAVTQVFAFYRLATGQRFARLDSWTAGATFIRAPFSSATLFALYVSVAALVILADRRELRPRRHAVLLCAIVAFGGGVMASMGRSLWISVAVGLLAMLAVGPWNRRTARVVFELALGGVAALFVVVVVDQLSPSSSGAWVTHALEFFLELGTPGTPTRAGRFLEWTHALDVWLKHPFVGAGFGYPFPDLAYNVLAADTFYMHNSYLNVMAKCGLAGVVGLLALIGTALRSTARTLAVPGATSFDRLALLAIFGSLAEMATLSMFSPVITAFDSVMFFALLLGLAAAMPRTIRSPYA